MSIAVALSPLLIVGVGLLALVIDSACMMSVIGRLLSYKSSSA